MAYSVDILNNIRMNASTDYANRIPEATQTNIQTIGQYFMNYNLLYNEFCEALVNKIGKTIIIQQAYKNPLARFKGGLVDPHDIEEIFTEMGKAEGKYDPQGTNPLGRREELPTHVAYHRLNRQDYYAISLGEIDFLRVFRSTATLDLFIKNKIQQVYNAVERDEFLAMKNVIATFKNKAGSAPGFFDYEVQDMDVAGSKEQWARDFVKTVRKAVKDAKFLSKDYNVAGVETWSKPSDLVLIINKDVSVEVDVELLAKAFHQSDSDLKVVPVIIDIDDFGTLEDTYGILVDKKWFRIYDTLMTMRQQSPNAQGLFTNWFFHHHQILSASPFKTAMRFKRVNG